ncbi:hypothetical protein TNCV_1033911 [Trichonephila clavipes]|nr:hypothetical protein TNCV_1033911 [Trichonephila clavipes]
MRLSEADGRLDVVFNASIGPGASGWTLKPCLGASRKGLNSSEEPHSHSGKPYVAAWKHKSYSVQGSHNEKTRRTSDPVSFFLNFQNVEEDGSLEAGAYRRKGYGGFISHRSTDFWFLP